MGVVGSLKVLRVGSLVKLHNKQCTVNLLESAMELYRIFISLLWYFVVALFAH